MDRGAYHTARGPQQGRRATQPGDSRRSRGEARKALTASERTQSNEAALGSRCSTRRASSARAASNAQRPSAIILIAYAGDLALPAIIDRAG